MENSHADWSKRAHDLLDDINAALPYNDDWAVAIQILLKEYEGGLSQNSEAGETHWAIKCLLDTKVLIERYNKELPNETSKCSNHTYNEINAALIKNNLTL